MTDGEDVPPELKDSKRLKSRRVRAGGATLHPDAEARRRICDGLEFLGIAVDEHRNAANAPVFSTADGRVAVRVIRTDEELLIARAAAGFIPRSQETLAANS